VNGLVLVGLLWGASVLVAIGWYVRGRLKLKTDQLTRLDLFRRAKVGGRKGEE